jgi:hypothetical protein
MKAIGKIKCKYATINYIEKSNYTTDLLETLPKQKALIRKCNLKVAEDYRI